MILTVGQVGLFAVSATLIGVISTRAMEVRKLKLEEDKKWRADRRDAYKDFLFCTDKLYEIIVDPINEFLKTGKATRLDADKEEKYMALRDRAQESVTLLRLVGSAEIRRQASSMIIACNELQSVLPGFSESWPLPTTALTTADEVKKTNEEFYSLRDDFITMVRHEFQVEVEVKASEYVDTPELRIISLAKGLKNLWIAIIK